MTPESKARTMLSVGLVGTCAGYLWFIATGSNWPAVLSVPSVVLGMSAIFYWQRHLNRQRTKNVWNEIWESREKAATDNGNNRGQTARR